ncbi:MAG: hypothetical protein ACE37E_04995 [Hyphomicrobiales bacterium]
MHASPHSSTLTPISRRARWVAVVPLLAAGLLLVGLVAQWVSEDIRAMYISTSLGMMGNEMAPGAASFPSVIWPMLFRTVPAIVFVLTMLTLFQLFRRLAQGVVLDERNAKLVSRAGIGFVLFAVTAMLSNTLTTLYLSMTNPDTPGVFSVGFTASDLGAYAAGFALWGLGLVLSEAARVADDHAGIV